MSSPSERILSLYQRFALDWNLERDRSPLEKAWLDRFSALLPLNPSSLEDDGTWARCSSQLLRYFIAGQDMHYSPRSCSGND